MERPIIFNDAMSLAVVELRKTVTRRPLALKHQGHDFVRMQDGYPDGLRAVFTINDDADYSVRSPFGMPGDKLWVREAWCAFTRAVSGSGSDECEYVRSPDPGRHGHLDYFYRASFKRNHGAWEGREDGQTLRLECPWRPSIHMPRWASRTVLDVLDVRVERLQSMSEEDAHAEGFHDRLDFAKTWESIYQMWRANPWVWRIEFKRQGGE